MMKSIHNKKSARSLNFETMEQRTLLSIGSAPLYLPPQYDLQNYNGFLTESSSASPRDVALNYVANNAANLGLTAQDFNHIIVTDQYTDADSGVTHIYLRQEYRGLEVINANLTINVNATGRVMNVAGGFVPGLAQAASNSPSALAASPSISAYEGLQSVAKALGLSKSVMYGPQLSNIANANNSSSSETDSGNTTIIDSQLSLDPIPVKMHYVPVETGGVALSWDYILRTPDGQHWYDASASSSNGELLAISDWVDNASYNVFARPVESPSDGSRSIVTDPNDPTASPYGWHDTNGVPGPEYTDTRGNNVFAQEDIDANNTGGNRPSGGASLNFDNPLDLTQSPSVYQNAAITNLFYWNNLIHDIHYKYGFTEVAGNFQQTNYTGLGLGNDAVQADAQDGSGTNNANFATPPDGQAPRMQMYIFTSTSPYRDGDLDNQIIVHEFGHGVSNRLVGGPSNVNALDAIQSGGMGEGWGDWWGLMFTQKTTDSKMAKYPVGTYVLGQTPSGAGIRRYPYSYDMTVDPLTYSNIRVSSEVHDEGEIWCSVLWDMNWLLIDKYGFNPDVSVGYSAGSAGNLLALKLVEDSLKLMPANPSFLQSRDALLLADRNLTGGANQGTIWTAFARRGMGYSAKDGGSGNSTSVTEAFDVPSLPKGSVSLSSGSYPLGSTVTISVTDSDLIANPTCPVTLISSAGDSETVVLTAQGAGMFSGSIVTSSNAVTPGDHVLQSIDGGTITVTYNDANDGTGHAAVVTATAKTFIPAQITTTTPPANGTFTLPGPFTYDVNFSKPINPASVAAGDLVLTGIAGATVTDVTVLPGNTTVRFTLAGMSTEGTLSASIATGAITDSSGNPCTAFSSDYLVDFGTVAFPVPLTSIAPVGSLIYDPTIKGTIGSSGDSDTFTLSVDPGQTISLLITPTSTGLQPTVQLLDPSGAIIGTATAVAAGQNALIQAIPTSGALSGTYKIVVGGAAATMGNYTVQVTLNAALELESRLAGAANNTTGTAQDLNGSFIAMTVPASSAQRGAALGQTDTGGNPDYYSFTAAANETDTLALTGLATGNLNLELLDSTGALIATGIGGSTNLTRVLGNFKIAKSATYYVRITGDSNVPYSLVVMRNAAFDTESNDTSATAQDLSSTQGVLGYLGGAGAGVGIQMGLIQDQLPWGRTSNTVVAGQLGYTVTIIPSASLATTDLSAFNFIVLAGQQSSTTYNTVQSNLSRIEAYVNAGGVWVANYAAYSSDNAYSYDVLPDATGVSFAFSPGTDINVLSASSGLISGPGGVITNTTLDGGKSSFHGYTTSALPTGGTAILSTGTASQIVAAEYPFGAGHVIFDTIPVEFYDATGNFGHIFHQNLFNFAQSFINNSQDDWFQINVTSPRLIALQTSTPGGGFGEFVNSLDPQLELYDPAGTKIAAGTVGPDGRNESINYAATVPGVYRIHVSSSAGSKGEYYLNIGTPLQLTLPTDATENGGIVNGSVSIPAALATDLVVKLVSSNPGRAAVPASVTILAGKTTVELPISVLDNPWLDGTESVTITATAADYTSGTGTITVHDDETAMLTVSLPARAKEGDGVLLGAGKITASAAPTRDIVVQLASSDTTEATVPATVILRAGQTTATFDVTIVDDALIDGTQTPSITASVENWTSGAATMDILDNDAYLTVILPADAWEGQGTKVAAGTVKIGGALPTDLVVSLASNDLTELNLPATVTIPAGQTSATFDVTIVDDSERDGAQTAVATASAAGLSDGTAAIVVHDDELDHLVWDSIATPKTAGVAFAATVRAKNIDNETILVYGGTVAISGKGDGGTVPVTPATATFAAGTWTGNVTVNAVDTGVVLTADAGCIGGSDPFNVNAGPFDHFQWSTIASTEYQNVPFPATVTAKDINGYTVKDYNGNANLKGLVGSGTTSTIVISEVNTDDNDWMEFSNVTPNTLDISGWKVYVYDWYTWPIPQPAWAFPAGTTIPAGGVFQLKESGASPGVYPTFYYGTNIFWNNSTSGNPVGILLQNSLAQNIDFFCAVDCNPATITFPTTIPTSMWQGPPVTFNSNSTLSYYRIGSEDKNNADDWRIGAKTAGTLNPGMTIPFTGETTSVAITPTTATFVNGIWSGNVCVQQAASNMYLSADDGNGHMCNSNTFNVLSKLPSLETPDLLPESDSGMSFTDNITNRDNSDLAKNLKFSVGSCCVGATVTVYADGIAIGSAVATGATTIVTSNASPSLRLLDGKHAINARQSFAGLPPSESSPVLDITIDTQSPIIQTWFSAATHAGGVGEALLSIPDDGAFSEPRDAGISRLLIDFNEPIDPGTFRASSVGISGVNAVGQPVDLSGISLSANMRGGNSRGVVSMSSSLPDYARYWVLLGGVQDVAGNALAGDRDRILTALRGDVNGDRLVNVTDLSCIKGAYSNPVDAGKASNVRADVNLDGRVDANDINDAWVQRTHDARSIPDPLLAFAKTVTSMAAYSTLAYPPITNPTYFTAGPSNTAASAPDGKTLSATYTAPSIKSAKPREYAINQALLTDYVLKYWSAGSPQKANVIADELASNILAPVLPNVIKTPKQ